MTANPYIFDAASKPSLPWHQVPLIPRHRGVDQTLRLPCR